MNSADAASELSEIAQRVPFPPKQRCIVLALPGGRTNPRGELELNQMQQDWMRWGGETEFNPAAHNEAWGVCIIERGTCLADQALNMVLRMMRKGADVFEHCPHRGNFRRLDVDDFKLFYCQ